MKILKTLIFLSVIFVTASCAKDEVDLTGSVYGKVTDAFTGEPLQSAMVSLTPGGLSTTTGSDGVYEFKSLDPGDYSLQVSKAGYITNTKRTTVTTGGVAIGDIALEPERDITLSVSTLNFGKELTTLSFEIRNNGSTKCDWNISGLDEVDWLEFNPSSGTLEAGKSNAVKVLLLRDKLRTNKETTILINSNKESVALKISAEAEAKTSKIELSTNTLNFGKDNSSLTFDIKNIGNAGDVNWDITNIDVDWLVVSPKSGSTAMGKSSVVKVDVDRNKLTENSTTNIIVNCEGESLSVKISADVKSARTWAANPTNIDFGTNSESSLYLYSYNGNTDYTLSVRGDASWLKMSKTTGTIPEYNNYSDTKEIIALNVDRTGLSAGTYQCELIAQSDLGELSIPVKMTVSASGGNSGTGSEATGSGEIISCDADLQFTLNSCTISGTTATINYTATYTGSGDIDLSLERPGYSSWSSYIYDDLGNQYSNDVTVSIGNESGGWVRNVIPSGVPVKCSIVVKNVDANASMFPSIKLHSSGNNIDEEYLSFKNIAISGRSKYNAPASTVEGEFVSCDNEIQFAFTNIVKTATTVTINYTATYTGSGDIDLSLERPGYSSWSSYMYDDLGTQYTNEVTVSIGNKSGGWVRNVIPSGVPVKCSIVVKNVDANASMFKSIKLHSSGDNIDEDYLCLKNVKFK